MYRGECVSSFNFSLTAKLLVSYVLQPPKETKGSITGLPTISTVVESALFAHATILVGRIRGFDVLVKFNFHIS